MAQLYISSRCEGPHFFVVRLRDDAGGPIPGIRIEDNGPKMGLNGTFRHPPRSLEPPQRH